MPRNLVTAALSIQHLALSPWSQVPIIPVRQLKLFVKELSTEYWVLGTKY